MKLSNVKLILAREVRDQLRDRRTLFVIAVLPLLLYPLLGMSLLQVSQFMRNRPSRVLVVGGRGMEVSPPLIEGERFAASLFADPKAAEKLELHFPSQDRPRDEEEQWQKARTLVQAGTYEAAIYFPPDFAERLEEFRRSITLQREARSSGDAAVESPAPEVPQPRLFFNGGNEKSFFVSLRLTELLQSWTQRIGEENLRASGLSVRTTRPFTLDTEDAAGLNRSEGVKWASILPVLLLLWALTGAFYPAVDLCAGEKERGTLETLLSSPAGRGEIVLGKLLTIMLFSMATAVLNLVSVGATGWVVLSRLPGFGLPPPAALIVLAVSLAPMAALFSALCLALAAFARSTREGQYYLMPLLLLTLPLVVLPMAPGVELTLGNSLIPITGVALVLRSMLAGDYWRALQFAPVVAAVTLAVCLMAIRWAVEQFNRESVLFRESERFDLMLWLRRLVRERHPTPTAAMALGCGALILLVKFYLGSLFDAPETFGALARSLVAVQLAAFALPVLLMTFLLTGSPRETLLLHRPRWFTIPAAALLAVALHPVIQLLQAALMQLYPVSDSVLPALAKIQQLFDEAGFWPLVLLAALLPAVCEELACRGFILSGFRHLGHKWRAIIYSAVLFGLAHGILQQSLLACLVGVLIGYMAVQSGSYLIRASYSTRSTIRWRWPIRGFRPRCSTDGRRSV